MRVLPAVAKQDWRDELTSASKSAEDSFLY